MESEMKRILIAIAALLLVTSGHADAKAKSRHLVRHPAASGYTVYNRDSPNPNIGWHNDGSGMRVCHNDCDNPEIPDSGARCHDVNFMGMPMRECVTTNGF
jgi:hypothetical protein